MGTDFAGSTASYYATFRRDVPDAVLDQVESRLALSVHDRVLDLGCGTGQLAVPLAARVGVVFALDPEPDMLSGLRARVSAAGVVNVLPVLAADADLRLMAQLFGQWFGVITVANALHWMDTDRVFSMSRRMLRSGGGLVVISQGPPMWLSELPWARALRGYLEGWVGSPITATCGTDLASAYERRDALVPHGFEPVELIEHTYENHIDLDYVAGHLYSAMAQSLVPVERRPEFESGLRGTLARHLAAGPLTERIAATALIAHLRPDQQPSRI